MALSKAIPHGNTGITLTYWNLIGVDIDFLSNVATVKLAGYVDQASRNAGNSPVEIRTVRWVGSQNPITQARMVAGTAFAAAYTKLTQAETNPFAPPNPFEGGTLV